MTKIGPPTFCDALERIPEDITLVLMEDYLLLAPPRTNEIARLARIMAETGAAHLRIFPCPGPDLPFPGHKDLGVLKKGAPYRTSLQAALWDRKALLHWQNVEKTPGSLSTTPPGEAMIWMPYFSVCNIRQRTRWRTILFRIFVLAWLSGNGYARRWNIAKKKAWRWI